MADALEEAAAAVETAQEAHEEAQARRAQLRERVDALEDEAAAAEKEVREAHEAGADLDGLEGIRRRRRRAKAEARDLRDELETVDGVVETKRQALREAEMDLAELRHQALQEEAEATASEIRAALASLADGVERMEALNNSANRLRSVFRDRRAAADPNSTGIRYLRQAPASQLWPNDMARKKRTIRQFSRDVGRLID